MGEHANMERTHKRSSDLFSQDPPKSGSRVQDLSFDCSNKLFPGGQATKVSQLSSHYLRLCPLVRSVSFKLIMKKVA